MIKRSTRLKNKLIFHSRSFIFFFAPQMLHAAQLNSFRTAPKAESNTSRVVNKGALTPFTSFNTFLSLSRLPITISALYRFGGLLQPLRLIFPTGSAEKVNLLTACLILITNFVVFYFFFLSLLVDACYCFS